MGVCVSSPCAGPPPTSEKVAAASRDSRPSIRDLPPTVRGDAYAFLRRLTREQTTAVSRDQGHATPEIATKTAVAVSIRAPRHHRRTSAPNPARHRPSIRMATVSDRNAQIHARQMQRSILLACGTIWTEPYGTAAGTLRPLCEVTPAGLCRNVRLAVRRDVWRAVRRDVRSGRITCRTGTELRPELGARQPRTRSSRHGRGQVQANSCGFLAPALPEGRISIQGLAPAAITIPLHYVQFRAPLGMLRP